MGDMGIAHCHLKSFGKFMFNFNHFYPPKTKNIRQKIFYLQANYPNLPYRELLKNLFRKNAFGVL
jgi:hypothetical protein